MNQADEIARSVETKARDADENTRTLLEDHRDELDRQVSVLREAMVDMDYVRDSDAVPGEMNNTAAGVESQIEIMKGHAERIRDAVGELVEEYDPPEDGGEG